MAWRAVESLHPEEKDREMVALYYVYGSHLSEYVPPEMIESKRKLYAKMMPVEKEIIQIKLI